MQQQTYLNKINDDGFAIVPDMISNGILSDIVNALNQVPLGNATRVRQGSLYAVRDLLNQLPSLSSFTQDVSLRALIKPILGKGAKVVRAIFFDKTSQANWLVPWHQDLTITVQKQCDITGFGPWSKKAGILHVQPPPSVLENMLTLRIHLLSG